MRIKNVRLRYQGPEVCHGTIIVIVYWQSFTTIFNYGLPLAVLQFTKLQDVAHFHKRSPLFGT